MGRPAKKAGSLAKKNPAASDVQNDESPDDVVEAQGVDDVGEVEDEDVVTPTWADDLLAEIAVLRIQSIPTKKHMPKSPIAATIFTLLERVIAALADLDVNPPTMQKSQKNSVFLNFTDATNVRTVRLEVCSGVSVKYQKMLKLGVAMTHDFHGDEISSRILPAIRDLILWVHTGEESLD